jgi:hypothetical protein
MIFTLLPHRDKEKSPENQTDNSQFTSEMSTKKI